MASSRTSPEPVVSVIRRESVVPENDEVQQLKARNAALTNEVQTVKMMFEYEKVVVEQMKNKLELEKNSRQSEYNKLSDENAEFQYQINWKERELGRYKARVKFLEEKVADLEEQLSKRKKPGDTPSEQEKHAYSAMRGQIDELTSTLGELKTTLRARVESGRTGKGNLIDDIAPLDGFEDEIRKETKGLKTIVQEIKAENGELKVELNKINGNINLMNRALERLAISQRKVQFAKPAGNNKKSVPAGHWKV